MCVRASTPAGSGSEVDEPASRGAIPLYAVQAFLPLHAILELVILSCNTTIDTDDVLYAGDMMWPLLTYMHACSGFVYMWIHAYCALLKSATIRAVQAILSPVACTRFQRW